MGCIDLELLLLLRVHFCSPRRRTSDSARANFISGPTTNSPSQLLLAQPHKDAATLQLIGQNYFMLGEYKKATENLERAAALDSGNASTLHWLGRAYGRRAETAGPFTAPGYASKARQLFEKSVALDPANKDATGDLLDYYLDAPGFLGGGMQKAEDLAKLIGETDPAEGHYAQALIDDHRKQYDEAEQQFRRAAEPSPPARSDSGDGIGKISRQPRPDQGKRSDVSSRPPVCMAPNNPRLLFERADIYIKQKRNLGPAREMLEKYLRSPLTADDPPRQQAEALLRKIGS